MKKIYALAVAPAVFGALQACSHSRPDSAKDSVGVDAPPPFVPVDLVPRFGPVVRRAEPPPPISGGTLAIAPDHTTAIAADPDRDRVLVVDLAARAVRHTVQLPKHSEPGRVAVDDAGHAYVVLRRAGGLAKIDLATGRVSIREVCVAPRGLAFDPGQVAVHVACASGELVTVPVRAARPHAGALQRRTLARDLRDVVMQRDGSMIVTTFRTASRMRVSSEGSEAILPSRDGANLAWRAVACGDATAVVSQQPTPDEENVEAPVSPGDYYGGSGIITTRLELGGGFVKIREAVLPVDLATNGRELAMVSAGNAFTKALPQIFVVLADDVRAADGSAPSVGGNVPGQAIAAAFDGNDGLVIQTREPAALHIMSDDRRHEIMTIPLAADSVADTGHDIFHANSGASIACASCHAEGADDGHVWSFAPLGARRTPSLLGTIAGTEPFHWDGDQKDLRTLVDHVFVQRMHGPKLDDGHLDALGGWLFALPEPTKLRASSDVTARGEVLFQERCVSCHAGKMLTNNATLDVGTGGRFQVPSLVGVGWRQPLIHSGCAKTLADRFDPGCGGAYHGNTASLSKPQVDDLIQFLETL